MGKSFRNPFDFLAPAWGGWGVGIGGLNPETVQKKKRLFTTSSSCYLPPDLEAGLSPSATMKRPCEDTTSDSDMDETIDVGSENNYSG